ncbi:MAG: OmpA/MotB domain protein [uncultured Thiotrichaceae bacterium]|uniref:OmpA/MotB domain protein n=1 Tax=uncultured Thiotrichaceae bacterium TaxID=298394 RepID=A0A6S6UKY8_9GAMM|nr:MAG: OmpA/MotB domain protein [uncultured Thiotrichaceae bacterium]
MTYRTWTIQIIGTLLIVLLFLSTIPLYTQRLPTIISQQVAQDLHKAGLTWAKVQAKDRNITLSGNAPHLKEHEQALQISQSAWFVKHVYDDITPKFVEPYTMDIRWNGKDLVLKGYVSSDTNKANIKQQVATQFAGTNIQQSLEVAAGAPENWAQLNSTLLKHLQSLQLASIQIIDNTIHIAGKARTSKETEALQSAISPFTEQTGEQRYTITTHIVALDNAAIVCQKEFNRLLSKNKIRFKTGNASIDSSSDALLEELADTAIFCADSTILISGHTDNIGSNEENLKLSEQRAKAVKGRLFNQGGVPLERLKTIGKGASDPLAENQTDTGRAKNRRIEFTVEGI